MIGKQDPAANRFSVSEIGWLAAIVFLAAISLMVLWARLPDMFLDHDEVEHLHASWLVSEGETPYLDFAESHNSTLWYLMAPLMPEGESPEKAVLAGRVLMAACSLLSLVLAGILAWKTAGGPESRTGALVAGLVAPFLAAASSYWSCYSIQIRPDVPMTTLVMLGLVLGMPSGSASRRKILLSGMAFGLAAVFLIKAGLVIAVMLAGLAVSGAVAGKNWKSGIRPAAVFAAGVVIPCLLFAALLQRLGILDGFWLWVVKFQKPYLVASSGSGFSILEVVKASLAKDPLLWVGLAAGLIRFLFRPGLDRAMLLAVVASVFVTTATLNQPNYQYLFLAMLLMGVLGGDAVVAARDKMKSGSRTTRALAVVMLLIFSAAAYRHAADIASVQDFGLQVSRMKMVLSLTGPDDTVIAAPPEHPIFRRDALYIWFNNPGLHGVMSAMNPSPPYDRFRKDPEKVALNPPAVIVKAGSKWHSFYGIGSLASRLYQQTSDREVLVLMK